MGHGENDIIDGGIMSLHWVFWYTKCISLHKRVVEVFIYNKGQRIQKLVRNFSDRS